MNGSKAIVISYRTKPKDLVKQEDLKNLAQMEHSESYHWTDQLHNNYNQAHCTIDNFVFFFVKYAIKYF